MTDAPIVVLLSPGVAVVIELDRLYFGRLVNGALDLPPGRALPPVPEWAPTAPTLVPRECWSS
jgi:hypothetical protein